MMHFTCHSKIDFAEMTNIDIKTGKNPYALWIISIFFTPRFTGRKNNYANKYSTTSSNYTIFVCLYSLNCKFLGKNVIQNSFLWGKISVLKKELVKKKMLKLGRVHWKQKKLIYKEEALVLEWWKLY